LFGVYLLCALHSYQSKRLQAFFDPSKDPYQEGYNYRLTRTAVGNGGLTGKGIFSKRDPVNLTNLDFVREQPTDFVFTAVAEEMGFIGAATLLMLYAVLLIRGLRAASIARDGFGARLATGLWACLACQVFVNVGLTMGVVG